MSPMRIQEMLESTPFRPFTVRKGDGAVVAIQSRGFAWLKPGGRALLVAVPRTEGARDEGDFEFHEIDVALISEVMGKPGDRCPFARHAVELFAGA